LNKKENQALAYKHTVFGQILKLVSRLEFEGLAQGHHRGRALRRISRWDQFIALMLGQLTGRHSLRDIVANMGVQSKALYHLGGRVVTRSTLSRVNERQPFSFYEALFAKLYGRCRPLVPGHGFRFKNKLYSLDASLIDLSLAVFPWANYNTKKAAMKLHVGLDHSGGIPAFAAVSDGKRHEVKVGQIFEFARGSMVVMDKGYTDYGWYKRLTDKGIYFVTRQRKNADYRVVARRGVDRRRGLTSDQLIEVRGKKYRDLGLGRLRRIGYRDPQTGKHYVFLTNVMHLSAATIAELYRQRWQVELFFKWIKQNLKIKSFLGTSKNAVMTQIWVALCTYLMLAYLKYAARIGWSMRQLLRLLQVNLFQRTDLLELLHPPPDYAVNPNHRDQLCLV
jgi:putative transposase